MTESLFVSPLKNLSKSDYQTIVIGSGHLFFTHSLDPEIPIEF